MKTIQTSDGQTITLFEMTDSSGKVVVAEYNKNHDKKGRFTFGGKVASTSEIDNFISGQFTIKEEGDVEAIGFYAGPDASYEKINSHFRKNTGSLSDEITDNDGNKSTIGSVSKKLDRMTSNNKASKPFTTYRAFYVDNADLSTYTKGYSFRDRGYTSTTLDLDHMDSFTSGKITGKTLVKMQINVKKGDKGVFVDNITGVPVESEFLMPRGQIFSVKSRRRLSHAVLIEAEVVNGNII